MIRTPRLSNPFRRARRCARGLALGFAVNSAALAAGALPCFATPPADGAAPAAVDDASAALRSELQALLDRDSAAWTRGDLEAFCATYADDATFVTPTGLTRGRATVLERYRAKYPTARERGELALELVEARPVAAADPAAPPAAVSVVARWRLRYPDRPEAAGWTLLVFHRDAAGAWRIVQDASM